MADRDALASAASPAGDLLHALAREHRDLDRRLTGTSGLDASAAGRRHLDATLLAVTLHEVAERVLLDPWVRGPLGRDDLADEREREERRLLTELDDLRGRDRLTARDLAGLHARFVAHSDREEIELFPPLRHVVSPRELVRARRELALLRDRVPARCRATDPSAPLPCSADAALAAARDLVRHTGHALAVGETT